MDDIDLPPLWKDRFLAALRVVPVVQYACDAASIQRCTAYRARKTDKAFAEAWEDAMESGVDQAELEAFRRGVSGYEEPVVYQGQLTPIWERDEHGDVVMHQVPCDPYKVGDQLVEFKHVPKQARDANGKPMWLTIRKHSDAMLSMWLKGRRKSVFADRTEITGADGGPLAVDETTRRARMAAILNEAKQRRAAEDFG